MDHSLHALVGSGLREFDLQFLVGCDERLGLSLLQPGNMGSLGQVAQNAVHLHRRGMSYMPLPPSEEAEALPLSNFRHYDEKVAIPSTSTNTSGSSSGSGGGGGGSGGGHTSLAVPQPPTLPADHQYLLRIPQKKPFHMERMLRPTPSLMFPACSTNSQSSSISSFVLLVAEAKFALASRDRMARRGV